jgi:membrane fusion protein (multidrug efflux system)
MRIILVYGIALAAVAAAVVLGFPQLFAATGAAGTAPKTVAAAPPVVVAEVGKLPFVDSLEALGTVSANESVTITANRADHISALHFDDGQQVAKGDLLAEMNVKEEKAQLAEATAVRDDRKANCARVADLFAGQLTSEREYQAAKALLAASEARVLGLQAAINDRQIRAPFAGTLGLRRVSVGAYLQPPAVITTLDDLSIVKLDFTIPGTWIRHLRQGMRIEAHSDAWPDDLFTGEVTMIGTRLDPGTRSVTVRARLPNDGSHLRPGMLLKVTILRGEAPVLQVPEEALIPLGDDSFVYRVGDDGVVDRAPVVVGRRRVGAVEILDGLHAGDRVVIEGLERARPGEAVVVVKTVGSARSVGSAR